MCTNRPALLLSALLLFVTAFPSQAREITADEAGRAAAAWVDLGYSLGKIAPGRTVASVETLAVPGSGAELRVAAFEGGGYAVLSADDRIDPVLAFSERGDGVVMDEENPLWALLRADIASRAVAAGVVRGEDEVASDARSASKADSQERGGDDPDVAAARLRWKTLLGGAKPQGTAVRGAGAKAVSSVSDVRVDALVKSAWSQSDVGGKTCWNYYTPNNYVCGCTATAIAQVMRYWQQPAGRVAARSYVCSVSGNRSSFSMMGGTYDWDYMPLRPFDAGSLSERQRQAIGKLLYDVGVTVEMNWAKEGSGASPYPVQLSLVEDFGYVGGGVAIHYSPSTCEYSLATFRRHACPSLDAGCPVLLGIPGHAVVLDGYGFSGSAFCIHVNFGWGSQCDAWYCPPDFTSAGKQFNSVDGIVANISPTRTGNIASGRVLSQSGVPVSGASVRLMRGSSVAGTATTDGKGIFAIWADSGSYSVVAEKDGLAAVGNVTLETTVPLKTIGHSCSFYVLPCSLGNSWGNDLALGSASVPAAPSGVSASDGTSTEAVVVSWNASAGAESYSVHRSTSANSGLSDCIASGIRRTTYADGSAVAGTTYHYWVKAENAVGTSAFGQGDTGWRRHAVSLAAALDNETLAFATGGAANWFGQADVSHDGTDAAEIGGVGDNQTAWLQTTVSGPGTLYFWWRVSCQNAGDFLQFLVDGSVSEWMTGHDGDIMYRRGSPVVARQGDWFRLAVPVSGAGAHALRWAYVKDGSLAQGRDKGWVDQVVWSTGVPDESPSVVSASDGTSDATVSVSWDPVADAVSYSIYRGETGDAASALAVATGVTEKPWKDYDAEPGVVYRYWVRAANGSGEGPFDAFDTGWRARPASLNDALDNRALRFETGGDAVWIPQEDSTHDGCDAARTGPLEPLGESWVKTAVRGPGTISFWWRADSAHSGWIDFSVDGEWRSSAADDNWSNVEFEIADEGEHVLEWKFVKSSGDDGVGFGFLDQVEWISSRKAEAPKIGPDCSFDPASCSFTVAFEAEAGGVYKVQRCERLGGEWTTVAEFVADSTGSVLAEIQIPEAWTSGFVRVVVERQSW